MTDVEITLQGLDPIKSLQETERRLSLLLWGEAGAGKTVYACSAPGKKLLLNFDPDGPSSLGAREDVFLADLSASNHSITTKFDADDPFKLSKVLSDKSIGIGTVVVDSITAFSELAVDRGVSISKGATTERPSPGAYQARNRLTLRMITAILRVTKRYNTHVVLVSHEDAPERSEEGTVLYISMMLGGKLTNNAGLQVSEIWHLSNTEKGRRIMVRPGRMRKPMKTRIFDTEGPIEFMCKYKQFGPDAPYGEHSLAAFLQEWQDGGYKKLKVPA